VDVYIIKPSLFSSLILPNSGRISSLKVLVITSFSSILFLLGKNILKKEKNQALATNCHLLGTDLKYIYLLLITAYFSKK